MDKMDKLIEFMEESLEKIVKEKANTLEEMERSVRLVYSYLTVKDRHENIKRGKSAFACLPPDGMD